MTDRAPVLVWLRDDLRLGDNPALDRACGAGAPLILIYVLDTDGAGGRPLGGAARWWLAQSLKALSGAIARRGGRLVLRSGSPRVVIPAIARETGASLVTWNRRYEADGIACDTAIKAELKANGVAVETFSANLLREPWTIETQAGAPFKVFTPFWRAHGGLGEPRAALPAPSKLSDGSGDLLSERLDHWRLEPACPNWAAEFPGHWQPGEDGAKERLADFLDEDLPHYTGDRDRPDKAFTSRLSPHLRFGEISPVQIWHAGQHAAAARGERGLAKFMSEVGWREFSYHLLFHWPKLASENFQPRFDAFGWADNAAALEAWQQGRTGYPLVDAGMRQLWRTGWMHNRVRMIAASFLVKHLLIDWRVGERWFWDTLVDADPASNAASWQWVAGTGADAAPYFRIFNPVLQGEKFDPNGDYVRHWVPELAALPAEVIHAPWQNRRALEAVGIVLGRDYPEPVVDHARARARALAALAATREAAGEH
ncbi:MAG: deoxyribodipyrimidine photo-lyase [Phreatobacter sp.]|uniref:cryptochrome/photolyase family protein n=1 Tax=Phreatobacter sp. TaxID=1966341 RepID=UPI001A56152E|nr:deoxyribodipyrimidine photo-lyase [Phreatobacter sp.]MBL8569784.1 deoxyribodipyrimidine photo-lyase [Phreatobacter sp.]